MNRLERCEYAIEKGYTYNPETGKVYNKRGKELNAKNNDNYLVIRLIKDKKGYQLYQHQFAWYFINKEVIDYLDHINQDKTDNRIINLRSVTNQQNQFNTNAKGCYWYKTTNKWLSQITINGKAKSLGYYNTEEEASNVYIEAKKEYHKILTQI